MRPSATVVLARAGAQAAELYLVRRASGATFGASYVFPGGLLEAADREAAAHSALPAEAANRCLGVAAGGLDYYSAAIRELFEETGVLLARARPGAAWPPAAALARARERLNDGALRWSDFLEDNRLVLASDALHYFAWWITPRARPKRFSTRFFLATLPDGQEAAHDRRELTDGCWMTVAGALQAAEAGRLPLPPPTRATLRDLGHVDNRGDLEDLVAWARAREWQGVPRILPAIVREDGRERIVMPGEPGYPPDADQGET